MSLCNQNSMERSRSDLHEFPMHVKEYFMPHNIMMTHIYATHHLLYIIYIRKMISSKVLLFYMALSYLVQSAFTLLPLTIHGKASTTILQQQPNNNSWINNSQSPHAADNDEAYHPRPHMDWTQAQGTVEDSALKANRFSKFAPSQDLEPDDFRAQLKENMKKDLERRRQQDPNRGNQPAKNYLDSL